MTPTLPGSRAPRAPRPDERGVALLVVVMVIALITIVVTEFAYNSKVELIAATNFRDELRAHYLLRSSANLSRLLFKIQKDVVDRSKMLGDVQVPHYAPYLIGAFAHKDEAEALGSLLGVDATAAKGLGIDGGTVDAEIVAEDGKVNLNCGGNAKQSDQTRVSTSLLALLSPAQFNPLFERPDAEGEHHDRAEIVQALIDWADANEERFGVSGAPEDYGYESLPDPYEARNGHYDTLGEIRLVRGVGEDFIRIFGDALTVWGGCKVNVNEAPWFVLGSLIWQHAENPVDPIEALQLAIFLTEMRTMFGAVGDINDVMKAIEDPETLVPVLPGLPLPVVPPQGIPINEKNFKASAKAGKREIWRVKATAEVGRVRRQLLAVWDMNYVSQTSQSQGTWVYWREE